MTPEDGNGQVEAVELAKDSEGVVELRAIELDPGAGKSGQVEKDLWTPEDTLIPPEDPLMLSRLTEASQPRKTCLEAMARNTVGLGWDVMPWPEHEGDVNEDMVRDARHALDSLARRDKRLDRPAFWDLIYAVKHDTEECGNGGVEVSRNKRTGKIDGLYHVPGKLIRRKKDRDGWVMGMNESAAAQLDLNLERTDFYNFGEKVAYNAKGEPQPKLAEGATRWSTNELIPFKVYTSESRDYGLPRDSSLVVEYAAARFVAEWTSSFFESSGTPPTALFIQGEETRDGKRIRFTVPTATVRRIEQGLKTGGAPGDKVVIIPVPPGTQVKDVKLGQMSDRDLTFGEFKKLHRHNVGSAFRLMPIFYGDVDDSGRYTAEVQRALTLEQVFDPDQRYVEDRLWTTLMGDLGFSPLRVVFKRLAVEGNAVKRESAQNGAEIGAVTMGEWRDANGLGPLPEQLYGKGVNDRIINAGPPPGAENRVAVEATEDTRGLRPGIGGRVAKHEGPHGVPHVERIVDELSEELVAAIPNDEPDD